MKKYATKRFTVSLFKCCTSLRNTHSVQFAGTNFPRFFHVLQKHGFNLRMQLVKMSKPELIPKKICG